MVENAKRCVTYLGINQGQISEWQIKHTMAEQIKILKNAVSTHMLNQMAGFHIFAGFKAQNQFA